MQMLVPFFGRFEKMLEHSMSRVGDGRDVPFHRSAVELLSKMTALSLPLRVGWHQYHKPSPTHSAKQPVSKNTDDETMLLTSPSWEFRVCGVHRKSKGLDTAD